MALRPRGVKPDKEWDTIGRNERSTPLHPFFVLAGLHSFAPLVSELPTTGPTGGGIRYPGSPGDSTDFGPGDIGTQHNQPG